MQSLGGTSVFRCDFFALSDADLEAFEQTFPGVPIETELRKMELWLRANPNRLKKNYFRFIVNWLSKTHRELLCAQVRGEAAASYKDRVVRREVHVGEVRR